MIIKIGYILLPMLGILVMENANSQIPIYKNPEYSVDQRVEDLMGRMTLEEKFWQLYMIPGDLSEGQDKYHAGIFGFQVSTTGKSSSGAEQLLDYSGGGNALQTAKMINRIQKYFVEESRLGIPIIAFDEALHGLVRPGATAFPQSIGLAATWDTSLMNQVSTAIAREVKSRGIRQILSPVLNIARDVRWGRTEETYGEDPYLTSAMGLAFIRSFEKAGIITTPKHFIANVGDGGRDSYPIHFSERLFEEIYFPAFKKVIQEGGARSIMTSYNSINGRQATAHDWLLNQKLKKEWGFPGFVISDAGATGGANVLHFTARNYAESTAQAIEKGLDVIFQTSYDHYTLFYEAFEKGMINSTSIDNALRRVLKIKFELGLFENPYVDEKEAEKWSKNKDHQLLAKEAAKKSIVLLKNNRQILPLLKTEKIAIIGEDAVEARLGGYSGPGNNPISILDGMKAIAGDTMQIFYAPGIGKKSGKSTVVPGHCLFHRDIEGVKNGLKGSYFDNPSLTGSPVFQRIDESLNFRWTLFSPDPEKLAYDWYSARWNGMIRAPESGRFQLGIEGDDGYRLFINDSLLIDNWVKKSYDSILKPVYWQKDSLYNIRIEYYETTGNARLKLVWKKDNDVEDQLLKAAKELANTCDAILVAMGIEEGEFQDRAILSLPGRQEELILTLAETGKPVIVILVGGSAITMNSWLDKVDAVLQVWYPGEQGGKAIAEVITGSENPGGRLPITFPRHEGQLPLYYNHKPTGRGDDYIDLSGRPLFPFGFGLSYTTFEYSDLKLSSTLMGKQDTAQLSFTLTNTGLIAGDEVVQLYIRDLFASLAQPIQSLKGFQRVHLAAGESKKITFAITPEMLQLLNQNFEWEVEPGEFRIMIGASSRDIKLRKIIKVE